MKKVKFQNSLNEKKLKFQNSLEEHIITNSTSSITNQNNTVENNSENGGNNRSHYPSIFFPGRGNEKKKM